MKASFMSVDQNSNNDPRDRVEPPYGIKVFHGNIQKNSFTKSSRKQYGLDQSYFKLQNIQLMQLQACSYYGCRGMVRLHQGNKFLYGNILQYREKKSAAKQNIRINHVTGSRIEAVIITKVIKVYMGICSYLFLKSSSARINHVDVQAPSCCGILVDSNRRSGPHSQFYMTIYGGGVVVVLKTTGP